MRGARGILQPHIGVNRSGDLEDHQTPGCKTVWSGDGAVQQTGLRLRGNSRVGEEYLAGCGDLGN